MAPREFRHALDDILAAIEGIQQATEAKNFADFDGDWLLRHGVQRGIEIISEASRAIPADVQALRPEVPWKKVRAIGNVLRHEYHSLSDRIVWAIVAILAETDPRA